MKRDELRIELVDSIDKLNQYSMQYDALTAHMDGTCFPVCQRYWIQEAAPVYIKGNRSMFFLFAWRNNELVGVAPLQKSQRSVGVFTMNWLTFWGQYSDVESLNSLTGDFLIPDESNRKPCMEAFKKYLSGQGRNMWDIIKFERFCDISQHINSFQLAFPEAIATKEEMPGFLLEFPASWDELAANFKTKTLKNLRRSLRLLNENSSAYEFTVHEQINNDLLDDIAKVHSSRQSELLAKGRYNRDAPFTYKSVKNIIRNLLKETAIRNKLRIYCLNIGNQLAAFSIVLENQNDTVCWLIAFDEQFQSFSPSRLVFQYMYTTEIEQYGTKRMNLMLGFTRTKKELSTHTYESWNYEILNEYSLGSKIKRPLYTLIKKSLLPIHRFYKQNEDKA